MKQTRLKKQDLNYSIVELPKEINSFLEEEYNKIIGSELKDLNENEKNIMNLFIQEDNSEEYKHPWIKKEEYACLFQLRKKNLIIFKNKDDEYIELKEYTIKNFNEYSNLKIQRTKIDLNLENVEASILSWRDKKK